MQLRSDYEPKLLLYPPKNVYGTELRDNFYFQGIAVVGMVLNVGVVLPGLLIPYTNFCVE